MKCTPIRLGKSGMIGSHSYRLRNLMMSRFRSEPLSATKLCACASTECYGGGETH